MSPVRISEDFLFALIRAIRGQKDGRYGKGILLRI
jgi:hypothetical protein